MIGPLFQFAGAWLIVLLPAIVYATFAGRGIETLLGDRDPVLLVLVGIGAFLWPISVLIVAFGGLSSWLRVDLVFMTLVRTFVPYLVTLVLTGLTMGLVLFAERGAIGITGSAPAHPLALSLILGVLELYLWLVTMMAIVLFYRHFKASFAWRWE